MALLIVTAKPGRLGNCLFLFAHLIAFAREHGHRVANPAFDEHADLFEPTAADLFCRYPARPSAARPSAARRRGLLDLVARAHWRLDRAPWLGRCLASVDDRDAAVDMSDPAFVDMARRRRAVFVRGWRHRDRPALRRHAADVRAFFRPRRPVRDAAARVAAAARAGGDLLVGVHARRGDYRTYLGGRWFYPDSAYARLMWDVVALHPHRRVRFLVASDEPFDPAAVAGLPVTFANGSPVEDLYTLARCDLLMGPFSTFSGWAAFAGDVPWYLVEDPDRRPTPGDFRSVHDAWAVE